MTRALVTGASGFIGANLIARLKQQGYWVRGVDIKRSPHREDLYHQANGFRLLDLRTPGAAEKALEGVDEVYHLAADHGGAGYFYSDADFKAARNNLMIDERVLSAALKLGADRLFFASSACTYPTSIQGPDARPLRESDLGQGEGEQIYGQAKRMSTILMEGARSQGLDARSGIFHTIYGPGQDYREPRAKFPTAICRKLIENPDRVEVWGDGTQVRSFLYIDDAIDRILQVMRNPYRGPVNVGSDVPVSIRECCEWAANAAGATPEWVWVAGPVGVACRCADNSEWDRRYGHTPLTRPSEGFRRTYLWLKDQLADRVAA